MLVNVTNTRENTPVASDQRPMQPPCTAPHRTAPHHTTPHHSHTAQHGMAQHGTSALVRDRRSGGREVGGEWG
ncbi:hypothetical protein E2C01_073868 [Portunus trituberculatus]|uniref:Uncharacterized protein n=1 Tax=Portunus trituberculatus TaxID=210409 RepID=A0A5B7IAV0_PORTR|nr:hypothetical protein [Portunus trituberculatus]